MSNKPQKKVDSLAVLVSVNGKSYQVALTRFQSRQVEEFIKTIHNGNIRAFEVPIDAISIEDRDTVVKES